MSLEQNSPDKENEKIDVEGFINDLHGEIMDTYQKLIKLRREKRVDKIEEMKILLDGLQEDYNGLVKTHSAYLRMTKLNGKGNGANLADMARLLQEIKSNVGGIVQSVENNNNGRI